MRKEVLEVVSIAEELRNHGRRLDLLLRGVLVELFNVVVQLLEG